MMTLYGLLLFGPGVTAMVFVKRADDEFLRMPWPFMVALGPSASSDHRRAY
jgi:hypothetical protein